MSTPDAKSLPSIGFLTVRQYEDLGLIGGYLILNTQGRPLEFHCTAPVRPNRAQQILYGPTLGPYLYGEQIGQALVEKGKLAPMFICTDVEDVLALREHVQQPVVFVARELEERVAQRRLDSPHHSVEGHLTKFELEGHSVAVSHRHPEDARQVQERWTAHAGELDLAEPFSRLNEAIEETQSGASRA